MRFETRTAGVLAALALLTHAGSISAAPAGVSTDIPSMLLVPQDWARRPLADGLEIVSPESDLKITLVTVDRARGFDDALRQAWQRYRGTPPPVGGTVDQLPARDGWSERVAISYPAQSSDGSILRALALRNASRWLVVITSGSGATAEKRSAAVKAILASLHPSGYVKETFAGRVPARLTAARIAQLRGFVERSMRELDIPGVAFALIDHGKIVYEGGLGARELGKPGAVDARTLFPVASNTKGMTTLLLAKLVDMGKLRWDEPVTAAYPPFRLGNAETTRKVQIRHLVCACTGLPRRDSDWFFNTKRSTPAAATFDQLALSQPTSGFGQVYQYNNLMASAAGYVAGYTLYPEREVGAAYDTAMQELVFGPLDMTDTTFAFDRALSANHASPHDDTLNGIPSVVPIETNYISVPYRPAGGAWSSAHDMILYVRNELSLGVGLDGRHLFSAANMAERRRHGVATGDRSWYGMGLIDDRTWGVSLIHHGGSAIGFKSEIVVLPEAQVGAVILTNSASAVQGCGARPSDTKRSQKSPAWTTRLAEIPVAT